MWNALRGDVMDFVQTIQKDVVLAMDEINSDQRKDTDSSSAGAKSQNLIEEIANSRSTFTEEVHHHEYAGFRESFMIDDYAGEIARLLTTSGSSNGAMQSVDEFSYSAGPGDSSSSDGENITTYYNELVPEKLSQEEFWARYFFRVSKLARSITASASLSVAHLDTSVDDDEEENIPWDDDIEISTTPSPTPPTKTKTKSSTNNLSIKPVEVAGKSTIAQTHAVVEENRLLKEENRLLFEENVALKGTVGELREQLATLTAQLQATAPASRNEEDLAADATHASPPDVPEDEVGQPMGLNDRDHDLLSSSTASLDSSVDGMVVVKSTGTASTPTSTAFEVAPLAVTKPPSKVLSIDSSMDDEEEESWD